MGTTKKGLVTLVAAGAIALLAAIGTVLPGKAQATATTPIQHVVVIYLENHTFDNVLGFWCDQNQGRCPDGGMPAKVTLSNGAVVTPRTAPDVVPAIAHETQDQRAAINGGKMNGWQKLQGCQAADNYGCIVGYQPSQVPNITGLAAGFAISDRMFSMADSASWIGHVYAVAASTDRFDGSNPPWTTRGWGCDSGKRAEWIAPSGALKQVPSCIPDWSLGLPNGGAFGPTPVGYEPTILDRLDAAGRSWKIYGAVAGQTGYGYWDICPTFAECLDTPQVNSLVPDAQFAADAASGNLPAFSVVTPGGPYMTDSCHNLTSMTACDNWLGSLVNAVENSPAWSSTAVFITWDDCGCFYDQVPPPVTPDYTKEGPRVPLIIVSPYAKAGYTDTTPATFASVLAYTEHNFGLAPLGPNDAYAYDFANAFNYSQVPLRPRRLVTRPLPASARHLRLPPALLNDPT